MKFNKGKRILAIVLALLMVVGSVPVTGHLVTAKAEETADTPTYNFDLSGIELTKNEDGTFAALEKTENFVAGDTTVLATSAKKVKIEASSGVSNEDGKVFEKRLNLGGTGNATYRAVKLVLDSAADVTVWALSGGAAERVLKITDEAGSYANELTVAVNTTTVVTGQTVSLNAGTYYIYSKNSGINIFDIDIQWSLGFDLSGIELTKNEDGTYAPLTLSENFNAGNVQVLATSSKTVKLEAASGITDENGDEFSRVLNLGGTGSKEYRAVKIEIPSAAEITVWALSGSTDERTLKVVNEAGEEAAVIAAAPKAALVQGQTVSLAAGTYYIHSANKGISVFDIKGKYTLNFDLSKFGATADAAVDITEPVQAGDFTLVADSNKLTVDIPAGTTDTDGNAFEYRLKLNGSGSSVKRAVKFTLKYKTTLDVYALSGGADARTLNVESEADKSIVATISAEANSNTTVQPGVITLAPGTYYIYSAGKGINIFDIRIHPEQSVCAWADVEAPVINSVTVNEDNGNFVVDFKANVDRYNGAEYVMISMMSNGYEVSSTKISGKETSIEMTPYWNGDYTFVATAVRAGEAHKASQPCEIKDFKLRLKKPVFRMFENIGNGSVYVDWVNNEYADAYEVYYKAAGEADEAYKLAATVTEGNATITGLTAGSSYTVKVVAKDTVNKLQSVYTSDITVKNEADKSWYAAITGSAQTGDFTVTAADGTEDKFSFSVKEESKDKTNNKETLDITGSAGKLTIGASTDGKISDDEDGFRYYYTTVNPNTENFKLTATFKVTDTSLTPDNQTGFGVMATDILGINQFGEGTYVHKYYNNISVGYYSHKSANPTFRYITGYNSPDASNNDTAERANNSLKFSSEASFADGNTYTFTLEKTNEKFIGTVNGQEISIDDTSILSVQEDGSICVGVYSARKVGVEISDIKFETSESTGVTGTAKSDKVTPSTRVYSTNTTGSPVYELIYTSNVAGTLTVTDASGKVYAPVAMKADSVARVDVAVTQGNNVISTVFTPDKNVALTSYDDIKGSVTVEYKKIGKDNGAIYVSPEGKADGAGTKESPMDLAEAVKYARAGQVIVLMDGEYTKSIKIPRSVCGTVDKNIVLRAENVNKAVFTNGAGLGIEGDYWHVYGIYVKGAAGVGIQIYGNYNTIEMCTVQGASSSGVQISRSGSATNAQGREGLLWPSYNLIKNCESFDNCDSGRNDADGFAAKLTCGEGNRFYGCIAHNNIDDGWDLYAKSVSGEIGKVIIENCVAYDNGWVTGEMDLGFGEGNGFKLGGGYLCGGHVLKNSISFNNHAKGITSNSCPDCEIYNCISYNNQSYGGNSYNVGLNAMASAAKEWKVEGLISMNTPDNTKTADLISFALHSDKNFIYDGSASYNTLGEKAEDSWFVSTDVEVKPTRNADGTINMNGVLTLTEEAKAAHPGVGAVLVVTGDAVSAAPAIPAESGEGETQPGETETQPGETETQPGETETQPGQTETQPNAPDTGDTAPIMLYVALCAIMAGAYAAASKKRRA